ncbi:MAG TPA: HD domain-containing protein [Thermomicrobiales bacterium]|nr:HD domain-containing protein [Thermomicrobiales bacterium]
MEDGARREPVNEPLRFPTPPAPIPLADQVADWLIEHPDWFEPASPTGPGEKYVRDPVHDSIVLSAAEARLIDSGPIQRLRGIFQVGLAWLAYPSARHSRFEHTLGVRHVAGCILDRLEAQRGRKYHPEHRAAVLGAALVHDVGHGVFSHASEGIIAEHPAYAGQLGPDGERPHEAVGALLIAREPLRGLLAGTGADAATVAALVRQREDDKVALLAGGFPRELFGVISGPLDADKLDYFARDSYFSGLPSLVDLDRILQTMTITPEGDLGITLAGASALEALLYSRITMHANLYGHQKVLAGESMIRGIIEELVGPAVAGHLGSAGRGTLTLRGKGGAPQPVAFRLVADYLRAEDRVFLAAPTDQPRVAAMQDRILRRDMFKRAYSLSYDRLAAGAGGGRITEDDYLRFLARLHEPGQLERLRWLILGRLPTLRTSDLWVRAVDIPDVVNTDRYVVDRAGALTASATMFAGWDRHAPAADGGVPLHPTLRTYLLLKAIVYVFCPPEYRAEVAPRAEEAVWQLFREWQG